MKKTMSQYAIQLNFGAKIKGAVDTESLQTIKLSSGLEQDIELTFIAACKTRKPMYSQVHCTSSLNS